MTRLWSPERSAVIGGIVLRMRRVFVTGGSGFVGRRLLELLHDRGIAAVALARSPAAAATVKGLGATAVQGDLGDGDAMKRGMQGCDAVIHAAARVEDHGPLADFLRVNVDGTKTTLDAARASRVPRFVFVSSEAVLADGKPIVQANESTPYPDRAAGPYPLTKRLSEAAVLAASAPGFTTVAVRPRFIWGKGDTSVLPNLVNLVRRGRFAWIGDGHYPTSTCHVDNVVEGALLAAERGVSGQTYFLTDGPPVDLREFLTELLATQGVDAGTRTVPRWVAPIAAATTNWMKRPPVTKTALALVGNEVTVDDRKARQDLGYTGVMTRERGLAEMREERRPPR